MWQNWLIAPRTSTSRSVAWKKKGALRSLSLGLAIMMLAACGADAGSSETTTANTAPSTSEAPATTTGTTDTSNTEPPETAESTVAEEDILETSVGAVSSFSGVVMFAGVERGIFLDNGVDLELKLYGSGRETTTAASVGEVDFALFAASSAPAIAGGIDMRNVGIVLGDATVDKWDDSFAVWAHVDSGIETIADLEGRDVGVFIGTTIDTYFNEVLKANDMAIDSVNKVNLPLPDTVSAMENGLVDAVVTVEPPGSQVAELDVAKLITRDGGHIGYSVALSARTELLDSDPELIRRVLVGIAETAKWVRANPAEAAEITTNWIQGLTDAQAESAIGFSKFDPRIADSTMSNWEDEMQVQVDAGNLERVLERDELWYLDIIDSVVDDRPDLFDDLAPLP